MPLPDNQIIGTIDELQAQELLVSHIGASRETLDRFRAYQSLLEKWAPRINLVGASTLPYFWSRHILDSAQILPLAPPNAVSWVDFGSGAGFPGLVLAVLLENRPQSTLFLIEANTKRCAFLREAARAMEVKVEIIQAKIEDVAPIKLDVVTARAFTSLDQLMTYAVPWMAQSGHALFPKGQDIQAELIKASTRWQFQSIIYPSLSDSRGCVVKIFNCHSKLGLCQL
ncbi:16S rRNA (guanine(527)-N(7))-methyltransferase RsmG [Candidatus Phycosocius spiralis]|uniref:16S rRNA (guanine(527)-N(7))-methyltransferase RsmG n=1 Tax=Candidatus Phycosocius spiralis TaxID=2815099 RepID=UPI0024E14F91|nr:16S rRNA (guanine(527)-N(7))-methyltransferase RsmG [Candidatus Phycosocius spiralis]